MRSRMADSGGRIAPRGARGRLAAVLAMAGLAVGVAPMLAGADPAKRALDVEILGSSLGKAWDAGKIRVRVDGGKEGSAKVSAKAITDGGAAPITKTTKARLPRGGRVVGAKLTETGKEALLECTTSALRARVAFRTKAGKRTTKSVTTPVTNDLGPCSQGSENPPSQTYHGPDIPTPNAGRCDFLETSACLYPFPNDYFTVADPATVTGRRINLKAPSMPKNAQDTPIDPTDMNRADGFGPGQPIGLKVPGLQTQAAFGANELVPVNNLAVYADPDQRVVMINAATGERHPIFAELDANAALNRDRGLYIRPSVNFEEGQRYIVALRGLESADGDPLEPGLAFRAYRDRLMTENDAIEDRREHMEELFSTLQAAGIPRANLYLAWDFTVASANSIAGRALAIRDDAFARLGDTDLDDLVVQGDSPEFTIDPNTGNPAADGVVDFQPCSAGSDPEMCEPGEDDQLLRLVRGKVTVPCYLNQDGCPVGSTFAYDGPDDLMPNFDPAFDTEAPFTCVVPRAVVNESSEVEPARPSLYGHGLLGSRNEVTSGSGGNIKAMANDHDFVFCAVDWAGFSNQDIGSIASSLSDMSNFPKVADRVQQGFLNFMFLGRAMIHEDGFGSDPAFQVDPDGPNGEPPQSVIDGTRLFYDGNSQGGIMGGALTALAPDFERAVLGVPGMNYSTLLQRSVDFADYAPFLYSAYDDELERPLLFSLVQMLWDRAEANGYAQHMTDQPYPNTPAHEVLLHVAYGDHQVANLAAEVEARTIGASAVTPALDPGRHWDVNPLWRIPPIESYPFQGSAIVYWDGGPAGFDGTIGFGTSAPPNENVPPVEIEGQNEDPHAYPRRDTQARQQKSDFLRVDGSIQPCGAPTQTPPCYSNGYTGP
jgi:hypothetical protein